jgi:hypothetical protein
LYFAPLACRGGKNNFFVVQPLPFFGFLRSLASFCNNPGPALKKNKKKEEGFSFALLSWLLLLFLRTRFYSVVLFFSEITLAFICLITLAYNLGLETLSICASLW